MKRPVLEPAVELGCMEARDQEWDKDFVLFTSPKMGGKGT